MRNVAEAERSLALADEAYDRLDTEALIAHLSSAVRHFTAADDKCRAAMACVRLGDVLANGMGNLTAGRAWFARANRLLADEPPCIEQGWVAVAAMGCDVGDPAELLAHADLALERARQFGDVNLETKALADGDRLEQRRPAPSTASLRCEGTWWVVSDGGATVRLHDTKGLRYLAELIANPGVERHALDLVDRIEGPAPPGSVDRRALGDAGAAFDRGVRTGTYCTYEPADADVHWIVQS